MDIEKLGRREDEDGECPGKEHHGYYQYYSMVGYPNTLSRSSIE